VTARDLFAALSALPGVRTVPSARGDVLESRIVGGVEIARSEVIDERPLRRLWRERSAGGPTPLLLVVNDPEREGTLRALGPLSEDGPLRAIAGDDMLALLSRLPALSGLRAVRELAEELDRLDRGDGVAGLVVRGLGTRHLYEQRLRRGPRWAQLKAVAEQASGEWRDLLSALGYGVERRHHRGWLLRYGGRPVAVVLPVAEPAAFSRLDAEGRPPEGVLLNECDAEGVEFGLLASRSRLRLFEAGPATGSAAARYLDLDAAALGPEDRPLLGLLGPAFLAEGGFVELMEEASAFGSALRERVDQAIREDVLPAVGLELGRWAESEGWDLTDDERRAELEAAALTFVFRTLFLLYAESAGHLPVNQASYQRHSLAQLVRDAVEGADRFGARSTTLWRGVGTLVEAMRTGDPALGVPPYNGALFAADGFDGAETLERASIPDRALGRALTALAFDSETQAGVDFSGLAIGHLGHIYEGLLSLRLSLADQDYAYDARRDRYFPAEPEEAVVKSGELLWLTNEGGRKGGGVYYTPEALVRHLVRRAALPAFDRHLDGVRELARQDPAAAADQLFAFRVLDPACGSAHFLVAVVDDLADRVARFLAEAPLPAVHTQLDELRAGAGQTYGVGVEDVALLRRLVLKRCVYGVDLSRMGAEIAKVSLWLASFVPGLSLSYLDHNVRVGNSLIGVADLGQVREPGEHAGQLNIVAQLVRDAAGAGADAAAGLIAITDRTPDEVEDSAAAEREAQVRVGGARRLLNLWTAQALGLEGAREELWRSAEALAIEGERLPLNGRGSAELALLVDRATELCERHGVLHWPLAFPEVFASAVGGFDAVVGNPPWEEVNVDEMTFYAPYSPGIRGLAESERLAMVERLVSGRPELERTLDIERRRLGDLRAYLANSGNYEGSPGNADLYKFFCQRYQVLLRTGGSLGVVLPRTAFSAAGSAGFREWLFKRSWVQRIDFLRNGGRWMFDTSGRYGVALLSSRAVRAPDDHQLEVAGVADSAREFARQSAGSGLRLVPAALGPILEVPLLRSQREADLLARLRETGTPFAHGGGRWRCFPVQGDFNETTDRELWRGATSGRRLWKGESFERYDPHGDAERFCPASEAALAKARKPRPGQRSLVALEASAAARAAAVVAELERSRVAFRDVSRGVDPRTIISALVPFGVFLTNKAPYLAFLAGDDRDRAACLGVMNSLSFDWQARRWVEISVNFFILEGLRVPALDDETYGRVAKAAARLSCPDGRYEAFAEANGVEVGPLRDDERERLLVEVDALVARAWGLDTDDLETVIDDFTVAAVPEGYRDRLRHRFAELAVRAPA
jgi:hypothetical protein